MKDSLGDRMKGYEDVNRNYLMKKSDVVIRLDGKAFHTFTRGLDKPFDIDLINAFQGAMELLKKDISGFKLAYLQSDEVSIWINDTDTIQTQGRFYYNINKINSVCASLFTAYFNKLWNKNNRIATFDCRCFNIPRDEIANYFLWRQKDWYRNSIQMYARQYFSQKELYKKKIEDIKGMLYDGEVDRDDILPVYKNGTFITKDVIITEIYPRYEATQTLIDSILNFNKTRG